MTTSTTSSTSQIDGIISGLKTSDILDSLMTAEAAPQTQLKAQVATDTTKVTAYAAVNTSVNAVSAASLTLTLPTIWLSAKASSTDPSVVATAGIAATTGSLTFTVKDLAQSQIDVSGSSYSIDDSSSFATTPFTLSSSTGSASITPASGSLRDMLTAINAKTTQTGVKATAVQVSSGQYRLQLSSQSGGSGSFTVDPAFAAANGMTNMQPAIDAKVHVGPASGGYDVTSPSNTFDGVLPGLTFTVSQKDVTATVGVAQDPDAIADKIQAMIDATNASLQLVSAQSKYDANGTSTGALVGDSSLRQYTSSMLDRSASPVGAFGSPSQAGIETDRDGNVTFDRAAFLTAFAADPAKAQAIVQGVANRYKTTADASSSASGTITQAMNGQQSVIDDLNQRITDWDDRLTARRATLQAQFTNMETLLSSLQTQGSALTAALSNNS
jgi:flagellar hook-associated protein 2